MAGNTFGNLFRLTTFGESHGEAVGGIIDGCPSGLKLDLDFIYAEMAKRRPGQSDIVSQRKEEDKPVFLSGVYKGKTTGAPIGFYILNTDARSKDYEHVKNLFRPSHADFTYQAKYGTRDYSGGGRSSARETVSRVVGGAIAKLLLQKYNIEVFGYTSQIGNIRLLKHPKDLDLTATYDNDVHCPDRLLASTMKNRIERIRKEGDTIGGVVSCVVRGVKPGLGEPVFDKLHAELAKAVLSIPAAKGFELGSGFDGVKMRGSEHNDIFIADAKAGSRAAKIGSIRTKTNHSGGIQGGISNGEEICFRVAFKPVSTIMKKQKTVDSDGNEIEFMGKGRHDPCVVPRAVPIVEAMTSLVLIDYLLMAKAID